MKYYYLIDYLKENYPIDKELLAALKYDLDKRIYHFGHQFKYHLEECKNESKIMKYKDVLKDVFRYFRGLFRQYPVNNKPKILSSAYFTYDNELRNLGFNVYLSPWIKQYIRGYPPMRIKRKMAYLRDYLSTRNFNEIISRDFLNEIIIIESSFKEFIIKNKFCALCVPYDMPFFENWAVSIFRKINNPSFILLHGLSTLYENVNDNSSDYLIVWGEKIKENYIKAGIKSSKIYVSGHPNYKEFNIKELKYGLENILVLTYTLVPSHRDSSGVVLYDRGNAILYLYSIQKILNKFGIKSVRLRPHPGENPSWYLKYIDRDFYRMDLRPLSEAIGQSSLVIGNSSTTFLETIYYGINYLVYEPSIDGYAWGSKYHLVDPFDGSNARLPVATTEDELLYLLKNKVKVDPLIFNDYIKTPFDLSIIKKLI